jgi:hypothetical protein
MRILCINLIGSHNEFPSGNQNHLICFVSLALWVAIATSPKE